MGRRRGKQNFFLGFFTPGEFLLDSGMGFIWYFLGFCVLHFCLLFLNKVELLDKVFESFVFMGFLSWCFAFALPLLSHLGHPKSSLNSVFVP